MASDSSVSYFVLVQEQKFLFTYLFNGDVGGSERTGRSGGMNGELERLFKEAVMVLFRGTLAEFVWRGTEENHESLNHDTQSLGVPSTEPFCS
jgi:hypothetical protein